MRRWLFQGERTLASPWRWAKVLLGLVFALTACTATGLGFGPVTWGGVAVAVVGGAVGLVLAVTGVLDRVVLGPTHLVHRDHWRQRTVSVSDVQALRVETIDSRLVWEVSVPVLHLCDGEVVALMALAGISYGQWRTPLMRRHVEALLTWWGGDPDAQPVRVEAAAETTERVGWGRRDGAGGPCVARRPRRPVPPRVTLGARRFSGQAPSAGPAPRGSGRCR